MSKNSYRLIYLSIGWIFTALGFVGAFLPFLPTTPFLLVAVWAFSKSSPKLRRWLFSHPKFGHHLKNWFEKGAIDRKAKILSLSFMGISLGISIIISENIYMPIALAVLMLLVATFIVTRPSPEPIAVKTR